MNNNSLFHIQENQYRYPYHYLVSFKPFSTSQNLNWGIEYYGYVNYVYEYIEKTNYDKLLDVGCGDGKLISILARQYPNKKYVGYDLAERAILLAKGLNYEVKNAKFFCNDFSKEKEQFDIITCIEVLEHIPDEHVKIICCNMIKKLKKGGKLIISVPSSNIYPVKSKHYRHYTLNMLLDYFPNLNLVHSSYLVKNNITFKLFCRISSHFHSFKIIEKIMCWMANKILFPATEKNCRHVVAVFEK